MFKDGSWRLAPAYDVAYCYVPNDLWVNQHWMNAAGKRKEHSKKYKYHGQAIVLKQGFVLVDFNRKLHHLITNQPYQLS